MNFIEIEVIAGLALGLEEISSDEADMPSCLHLCIPDDSQVYTLRDLLSTFSSNYKKLEKMILDRKTGRIKGNTVILLNGTNMDLLYGLDTRIKVGDRVALVPFLAGG